MTVQDLLLNDQGNKILKLQLELQANKSQIRQASGKLMLVRRYFSNLN